MQAEKDQLKVQMSEMLSCLRKSLGLSQTELGEMAEVSRQTISEIERGLYDMSWNQFTSFLTVFLINDESRVILENEMDLQSVKNIMLVNNAENDGPHLLSNTNFETMPSQ